MISQTGTVSSATRTAAAAATGAKQPVSPWLMPIAPATASRATIWCFPFAGGGASIYNPWKRAAEPWLAVQPVRLPGREARVREPAHRDVHELVEAAITPLAPLMTRDVALFGYSMGALVAFELARALRRCGLPQPAHLFICAHRAPHLPDPLEPIHHLSDHALRDAVKQRFGQANAALDNPELAQLLLPVLRADLSVCETYRYRADEPLDCPISVLGGAADQIVPREHLDGWSEHTRAGVAVKMFEGDHFFLMCEPAAPLAWVQERLSASIGRTP